MGCRGKPVTLAVCVWLGVTEWVRYVFVGLIDWLGVNVVVCDALGEQLCLIVRRRMPRYGSCVFHDTPLSGDTRLPLTLACPVVGIPSGAVDKTLCKLTGALTHTTREKFEPGGDDVDVSIALENDAAVSGKKI